MAAYGFSLDGREKDFHHPRAVRPGDPQHVWPTLAPWRKIHRYSGSSMLCLKGENHGVEILHVSKNFQHERTYSSSNIIKPYSDRMLGSMYLCLMFQIWNTPQNQLGKSLFSHLNMLATCFLFAPLQAWRKRPFTNKKPTAVFGNTQKITPC